MTHTADNTDRQENAAMTARRPDITSASVTLNFADGTSETWELHEGGRLGAEITFDCDAIEELDRYGLPPGPFRTYRPGPSRARLVIEALESIGQEKFATRTRHDSSVGGTTTSSEEQTHG